MDPEAQALVDKPPPANSTPAAKHGDPKGGGMGHEYSLTNPLILLRELVQWIQMLCWELNGSLIFRVFVVYGLNNGFAGSFSQVATDYYWKDVQNVQPSVVQMFVGLYYIPWSMKPV